METQAKLQQELEAARHLYDTREREHEMEVSNPHSVLMGTLIPL